MAADAAADAAEAAVAGEKSAAEMAASTAPALNLPADQAALNAGQYGAIHGSKTLCVMDGVSGEFSVKATIRNGRYFLNGVSLNNATVSCDAADAASYGRLATWLISKRLRSLKGRGWTDAAGFVSLIFPTAVLPHLPADLKVPQRPVPSNPQYNVAAATRIGTGGTRSGAAVTEAGKSAAF